MIRTYIYDILKNNFHLSREVAIYTNLFISIFFFAILGYVLFKSFRYIGQTIGNNTKTRFHTMMIDNRVFLKLSRLVVYLIIRSSLNEVLIDFDHILDYASRVIDVIIIFSGIILIGGVFSSIKDFLRTIPAYKDKPLESYVQIFMVILWIIGVIMGSSILTGKPLKDFLYGLGAFSAIFLLIFKDAILGFVASIQVSINDTVRIGDWLMIEKYGANGDVIEINLTSVIIKNFDNTISSVPTYHLISESFRNWRTMNDSGGRRIKRSVLIKMNSIKFLSNEEIEQFKRIQLVSEYIESRKNFIDDFNKTNNIDKSVLINGRNLTNFGIFRVYLDKYIEHHPEINHDLTFMSRQLDPTPNGIPLEIYAFSRQKQWVEYERVMANIFDHVLAAVKYFDLEVFESPSSADIKNLTKKLVKTETIKGNKNIKK